MEHIIQIPNLCQDEPTLFTNSNAYLVGGSVRKIIGYDPIPHPKVERMSWVAEKFQQAVGFCMPNFMTEIKHAYDVHKLLRETSVDLDMLVNVEELHPLKVAFSAAINGFSVRMRRNPWGASLYKDEVKIDLTSNRPSTFNVRTAQCYLSIDRLSLPIRHTKYGHAVEASDEFLNQQLKLEVIGDMSTMDEERAVALTLGFISKSQIKKNGQRIEIRFGDTPEAIKNTRELFILSLSLILLDKDKYQKFYDRLLYNVLNWDSLDSRIQEIIVLAFQFVNYKQKNTYNQDIRERR